MGTRYPLTKVQLFNGAAISHQALRHLGLDDHVRQVQALHKQAPKTPEPDGDSSRLICNRRLGRV
jgi:hypothetical protein